MIARSGLQSVESKGTSTSMNKQNAKDMLRETSDSPTSASDKLCKKSVNTRLHLHLAVSYVS